MKYNYNLDEEIRAKAAEAVNCKWAVCFTIDGKNYDDQKDRIAVSAVFNYPCKAEDYIDTLPEETKDRFFITRID
jgi:hypothetical protein